MSAAAMHVPGPQAPRQVTPRLVAVSSRAAAAGGGALLLLGLFVETTRAWFAYLQAWTFATTVALGALVLLMIGHASKAGWMVVTRRLTEALAGTMPIFLLLFAPVALGLTRLYPWAQPRAALDAAMAEAVAHKERYLNGPFFIARTVGYFAVFIAVQHLLRIWSRANDERPTLARLRRMRALSAGALPVVALAITWASFDWTMSLEPDWSSTIFGLYYFSGGFVGALGLVAVLLHLSRRRPELRTRITGDHASALGRVLFAMTIFWAYMGFSQLLIQWIADVPEEIGFYRLRTNGRWGTVCAVLVGGHFALPFLLLLNRRWKRSTGFLAACGGWLLAMHWVDVYWLILPVHDDGGPRPHWVDAAALLFVSGVSCASLCRRYFELAPLPAHDPELAAGLNYEASS